MSEKPSEKMNKLIEIVENKNLTESERNKECSKVVNEIVYEKEKITIKKGISEALRLHHHSYNKVSTERKINGTIFEIDSNIITQQKVAGAIKRLAQEELGFSYNSNADYELSILGTYPRAWLHEKLIEIYLFGKHIL